MIERLRKLQKKAIRILTKSGFRDHTDPLFKSNRILNIDQMAYLFLLSQGAALSHKRAQEELTELMPNQEQSQRRSIKYGLQVDYILLKEIISNTIPNTWNKLNESLRAPCLHSSFRI